MHRASPDRPTDELKFNAVDGIVHIDGLIEWHAGIETAFLWAAVTVLAHVHTLPRVLVRMNEKRFPNRVPPSAAYIRVASDVRTYTVERPQESRMVDAHRQLHSVLWMQLEALHSPTIASTSVLRRFASRDGLAVRVAECTDAHSHRAAARCTAVELHSGSNSTRHSAASLLRHDLPTLLDCGRQSFANPLPSCLQQQALVHPIFATVIAPPANRSGCGWPHDAWSRTLPRPHRTCAADDETYATSYVRALNGFCKQHAPKWRMAVLSAARARLRKATPSSIACCQERWPALLDVQANLVHNVSASACMRTIAGSHNEVEVKLEPVDVEAVLLVCNAESNACSGPPADDSVAAAKTLSHAVGRPLPLLRLAINVSAAARALMPALFTVRAKQR